MAAPGNYENGGKSSATSHGCATPGKERVNKQRNHGWLRYFFGGVNHVALRHPETTAITGSASAPVIAEELRMKVAIGADHAGFELKQSLALFLNELGHEVLDLGTNSPAPSDYPDFAEAVGLAVRDGRATRGILL